MFTTKRVFGLAMLMSTAAWSGVAAGQTASSEEVVVTGSRIARQDYSSDSPIVTLSADTVQMAGPSTLEATLNTMPQFASVRPGSGLGSRGGRNVADLRGLGTGRTLVLLDGRRMQPAETSGTADLNTIPDALIQSVEVITGGASATYGSDAIAGVVNFKLNTRFEGVQVDAQYGDSFKGDIGTFSLSAVVGGQIQEGRGHIQAAASWMTREGASRSARPFFYKKQPSTLLIGGIYQSDGTNLPTQAAMNAVFASYGITGINVPRNAQLGVNADGTLFTGNVSGSVPILNMKYGDPPYFIANGTTVAQVSGEANPLQQEMERYNVFAAADYDINEWVSAYGQFMFTRYRNVHTRLGGGVRIDPNIPITNPWIPADYRTILASRPRPTADIIYWWGFGKIHENRDTIDYNKVYVGLFGFKGTVPNLDWTWDVYATAGRTEDQTIGIGEADRAALTQLINAPDGGRSVCPGGYNPFSVVSIQNDPATRACYDFVVRTRNDFNVQKQEVVEASMQGGLFDLPAGELKFAVGGTGRRFGFEIARDANAAAGRLIGSTTISPTNESAEGDVTEFFGELLIPVIRDFPLVQEFNLDIAGRTSNYSTIGPVRTYKGSFDWQVVDPLRFRGSYSRAIRAPSLTDLRAQESRGNAAIGITAQGAGDPCDINSTYRRAGSPVASQVRALCLAQGMPASIIDIFTFNGNAAPTFTPQPFNIHEETADTYTVGAVLRSPFEHPLLSGLQVSADYYDIKVEDALGAISATVTLGACYNSNGASNPGYDVNNVFCQQITRSAGGTLAEIRTPRLNLAFYEVAGVDAQVDYRLPLSALGLDDKWGTVTFNTVATYTEKYNIQTYAGADIVNYTGSIGNGQVGGAISHPKLRLNYSLGWEVGDFSMRLRGQRIPNMIDSLDVGAANPTRPGVTERYYWDGSIVWRASEKWTARAGMNNITDVWPAFYSGATEGTDTGIYDFLGRRFYVGLSAKF